MIAALQKQTAGDATVLHNQRVKGRSGRMRQIDIMISQKVGLYPVTIVIECKRHRRPVGIDKVEAFVTKLRDVGASQGVMISNTGFDAGAKAIAKDNLVTLLLYREAESVDWHSVVGDEAWLSLVVTHADNISIAFLDGDQNIISRVSSDNNFYDDQGNVVLNIAAFYGTLEETFGISAEIGPFDRTVTPEQPLSVMTKQGLVRANFIAMKGEVKGRQYIVNLELASGHVLENAGSSEAVLKQVKSGSIDKDALLRTPGREISKDEYELLRAKTSLPPVTVQLNKVKRYLIEATKTA